MTLYSIDLFETYFAENNTKRIAYGLLVSNQGQLKRFSSISCSKDQVLKIMDLCCYHSVSFMHVKDIIEDYIFSCHC
ncbi:MAG: DUF6514 family protein [Oscillospiraceae bacterium]|jgi:hypothetical protein|nr:DUF6514 family protein [Oscillospiraceae bacterium]